MGYYLINLLFYDIPLLYYYTNLNLSIIFCLFSGDIYLSLGISLSYALVAVSELFSCEFFETPVTLLPILLPIKSSVASSVFALIFLKKF